LVKLEIVLTYTSLVHLTNSLSTIDPFRDIILLKSKNYNKINSIIEIDSKLVFLL
jgi:hypothetical protein